MEKNNRTTAADATVDHDAHAGLLKELLARVAPCFARRETRMTCRDMVRGLLTELEDHNCWTMAEAAAGPHRMQHLLSRARLASHGNSPGLRSVAAVSVPSRSVSRSRPGTSARCGVGGVLGELDHHPVPVTAERRARRITRGITEASR